MSRARNFTKAEILDAARAAAETGMNARLCPTGDIVFTRDINIYDKPEKSAEEALEGWLSGRKANGHSLS